MVDFRIRRGLSTTLFSESGIVNPRLVIEEGCWYLCTDTAELFLGVQGENGLTLKRINGNSAIDTPTVPGQDSENLAELESAVGVLQDEINAIKEFKLFKKLTDVSELPSIDSEDFNSNITYYIQQPDSNIITTYIFDTTTNKYLCLNNVVDNECVSLDRAEINADGELVLYYSNGDISTLGHVVGTDGKDGLVTSIKIGDKIYKHNEGLIELPNFATEEFVRDAITSAQLNGSEVDLSAYAKKEDLEGLASEDYVEDFVEEKLATLELPEMPSKIILLGGDATPEDDE
jgi:hypothetical protein